jgi:hypothetical protein
VENPQSAVRWRLRTNLPAGSGRAAAVVRYAMLPSARAKAWLYAGVYDNARPGNGDYSPPGVRFRTGCALQVRPTQPPEVAAAVKPSEQLRTESCVASGTGRCEA